MGSDVVLTVDESCEAVDAARFFAAGAELLELLDDLAETPAVAWQIRDLRMGSAVAVMEAAGEERLAGLAAARSAVSGLAAIQRGDSVPADWTPRALGHAKDLVRRVGEHSKLESNGTVVSLDRQLRDRLDAVTPWVREFYGSIRGQLTGVNVTRGNRASVRPTDGGRVVHVGFPTALAEQMKAGLLQFVEIEGAVRQNDQGRSYYVSADQVHVVPDNSPSWRSLHGLIPEITDGLSVHDYLEAIHGDE